MTFDQLGTRAGVGSALAATLALCAPALAEGVVDLQIDGIVVTQAISFASNPQIAQNATMVRALVSHDAAGPVDGVDAILRVFVDGVEAAWSPVRSVNGPIKSPVVPSELDIDDHVNFLFIAPESADVDFTVILNPQLKIPETNLANNIASSNDHDFECRGEVELVYVPIDYTPGGGEPDDALIEPGIGDGFLRAIYHPREWDYHRSPLPPLEWTENINSSSSALLLALRDIRINQLEAAGYSEPPLVFGWLPGNPFSGNGQAIGIPGDVAFGNTQTSRHQRTFAHEVGHLLNESHNSETVGMVGIDVEHHLFDTERLEPTHPPTQFDIMVGGQLTNTAFVSTNTYNQTHGDSRFQCSLTPERDPVELLRVAGVYDHRAGTLALEPVSYVQWGQPDPDRVGGNTIVILRDAEGNEIGRTVADIGSTRGLCTDPAHGPKLADDSPLHVLVPLRVDGTLVSAIDVVRAGTGDALATIARSANAPGTSFTGFAPIAERGAPAHLRAIAEGTRLEGRVRFEWQGSDADGDELTYTLLYSRDAGGSWLPLAVNLTEPSFEFSLDDIPASVGKNGLLRVVTSDGFNHAIETSPPMEFAGANPPRVFVITPNNGDTPSTYGQMLLHGTAWDKEDTRIADQIEWSSDVDGALGTGSFLQYEGLSTGRHTITASVTDSDGMSDSHSVVIEVTERLLADLDSSGFVDFGDIVLLLGQWGPCADDFCPGDFDLNGSVDFLDLLFVLSTWS